MLHDLDGALGDLNRAVELAPQDPASRFSRGFCYSRKGELDKSLADYEEAIRLDPDYTEVYRERGYVLALRDDYDKAMADLVVRSGC